MDTARHDQPCAACGQPGHRYGRNEGMDRFDRQACINGLLFEVERLQADLATCYRLTGADPDGNDDRALAPYAVTEVARLRGEADEADETVARLEARVAQLEGRDGLDVFRGKG